MARLVNGTAQMGAADGLLNDGSKSGSGTLTFDTGVKYGLGARSYKFDSGASNATVLLTWGPAAATLGTNTYFRGRFRLPAALANGTQIMYAYSSGGAAVAYYLMWKASDGSVDIKDGADVVRGNTGPLSFNTWYRFEVRCKIAAGANDELEFRVDGTAVCNLTGLSLVETGHIDEIDIGFTFGAPGANKVTYWADVAYNDSTGSAQNSWCGDGNFAVDLPQSDSAVGSWTGGAGGTTNLYDAVNNVPPVGVGTASDTNTSQIHTATDATTYTANLQSYTALGVGGSDTITLIQPVVVHAEEVTTGAKTGTVGATTNPTVAGTALTFGTGAAVGTYPSGWQTTRGTLTYNPSVTLGTAPTLSVVTTSMTSRFAAVCFMGLIVEVVAASNPVESGSASVAGAAQSVGTSTPTLLSRAWRSTDANAVCGSIVTTATSVRRRPVTDVSGSAVVGQSAVRRRLGTAGPAGGSTVLADGTVVPRQPVLTVWTGVLAPTARGGTLAATAADAGSALAATAWTGTLAAETDDPGTLVPLVWTGGLTVHRGSE